MVRAAIVGLGWWGQLLVNAVHGKTDEIRFVKAHTRNRDKVEAFCASRDIAWVPTLEEILNDPTIDAVVFATPHSQHAQQVIQAAAAGKHVFVEKPLALTGDDARRAADAAKAAGVILAVGYNRRFNPSMKLLRDMIRDNKLGIISTISAEQSSISGLSLAPGNWRVDAKEAPGAALTAVGVHPLDGMIDLIGRVKRVYAVITRRACKMDDTTNVMFSFENGVTGHLSCSIAVTPTYRMAAHGTLGIAEISHHQMESFKVVYSPAKHGDPMNSTIINTLGVNMLNAELVQFGKSIATKTPYTTDPEEVVHGCYVFEAIIKSAATGMPVDL
jgi:predicted dehydrogenase